MKLKVIIGVVVVGIIYVVGSHFGILPGLSRTASVVPEAVVLSEGGDTPAQAGNVEAVPLPGSTPAKGLKPPVVRFNIYPWTALHGFLFSIGGPQTTTGSLMEKHGVNLRLIRQDDVEKMKAAQAQFAQALASGVAHPNDGVHFVIIMGDGGASYLGSLNQLLAPLGPDYRAEIVGAVGYSRGEDACWGPQEWKDNPELVKGKLISAYLRDGDWNLCQYWLAQNGIKNNPDETTIDLEAANWVASGDFLKAVEQYVTGYCEDRKVVANGKVTSQTVRRCVEGTATWTPGDVNMAKQKGGLVHLMSTRENPYQMPAVIIGIRAWNVRNAKTVENLLTAALEGSEQVRHFEEALSKAGRIAFNVYGEQDAGYWVRYYKGVQERDKIGIPVRLGGSVTANLADNLFLFGLAEGAGGILSSAYNASYSGFGRVVQQQYPELLPSFPPIDEAVNTQFLQALAAKGVKSDAAQLTEFVETNEEISRESVVARRNWTINFDTGKATFTATALTTLDELYNQLAIGGALAVQIDGHTDSVGDPTLNHILSQQRADAVRIYLQQRNPSLFPAGRVITRGYGDTQPTAPNTTATGRAANRRVTITLGTI